MAETEPPKTHPSLSNGSTWSDLADAAALDEGTTAAGNPGLWSLLTAASHYDDPNDGDSDDESEESSLGPHTPPPPLPRVLEGKEVEEPKPINAPSVIRRFSNTGRLAQLTVNNFNLSSSESILGKEDRSSSTTTTDTPAPPLTSANSDPPPAPRDKNRIVKVLEREFGVLAVGDEVEEFVKETDCALLTDATILVRSFPFPLLSVETRREDEEDRLGPDSRSPRPSIANPIHHLHSTGHAPTNHPPLHIPRLAPLRAPRPRARSANHQSRSLHCASPWDLKEKKKMVGVIA